MSKLVTSSSDHYVFDGYLDTVVRNNHG